MTTVAEQLVRTLERNGVHQVWGVVGDALNPVTDAIRRTGGIDWVGVRHEEAGAFAASAQAQLKDGLAVCMGTVGPGSIHLLNGLYDAKKSHAPVLAVCGQVPLGEMGSDFFQEVDNDALFADVSVFSATITSPDQMPRLLEDAANAALRERGVAVLTLPGDVGAMEVEDDRIPTFVTEHPTPTALESAIRDAAAALDAADRVTLLVGCGARGARDQVLALAERLQAPMVLTLKAKDGLERDNPWQIGQSGLIGNPATAKAFDDCDTLLLVGTDFPYRDFLPAGKTVIQLDVRAEHIGRRTAVDHPVVGDAATTLDRMLPMLTTAHSSTHLEHCRARYDRWRERQGRLAQPGYDETAIGRARGIVDNPEGRIRPEVLAAAVDRHAALDAVFTSDTGMSTVWLSRFVELRGERRLVGSFNLGSMANAMPQALGAAGLGDGRQVIAFCGDGGLTMLLGDLITAVAHDLNVTLVVFDNGSLGMVRLEQEEGGLPHFGTDLANPDLAAVAEAIGMRGIRVTRPDEVDAAVREALAHRGPVLVDVLTNPDEVSLPPAPSVAQGWGFAIAKIKEVLVSRGDDQDADAPQD